MVSKKKKIIYISVEIRYKLLISRTLFKAIESDAHE